MGLALLLAHPQTIPREQTGLIVGGGGTLNVIPLGQMVAAFEQSPLARTHFILIRVLGALLVVASVAGLTYSVRHKAEGIIELVLFRLQRYAYAFFVIILTFFGGFLLIPALASTLSAVDHASYSSSASLTDNRLIEIYQPSYSEIQRRNPGLMGSAVPVANSLREQQTEFTIDDLQEIKSLTSGIDYVYSTQALSTEWQGRSVSIVEATSGFFPAQEWQLLAGHMPKDSSEVLVDATTFGITEPEQARDWLGKTVSLTILGEGHGLRIVGVVGPQVGRYAPALLRPAPDGRTWTSAVAIASPDRDPVAVAAALQQAMDQRYGRYAWRVEALQSRTWRATEIYKRSQSAVRWLGVLSLLLVFGTVFGINRAFRAKASSESTPDEPLPQGSGVPAFCRVAYHLTLGLLGGLLGAGVGKLVLARSPLPLLVPTTASAQAQPSAVLQVLIVAAAVGATTVIGSLVGGLMGCPSGNLVMVRHPQSTDDHSSRSRHRRQLSRLLTASFNTLLAALILSVGVGLLISFTSHEDMVRQAMREAESYGYLQLTPYASETGAAMSSELTESGPLASRPVGWAVVDLEYIRPYLPDRDTALALATSDEAYVYDQANNITYSALVIAGSAGLPAVRGWRLVTGRFPSEQEIADGAMVAVVSRDFGRLAWGVNNPNEYLKRSLLIRFTNGRENEYKELRVIGVMDWANLALRWGGGANTGFAPLPALFTPLGLSPQSLLPDGTVIGRSLEARSPQGDSRKLTSTLQQLASGFLRPTYGLVNIKDVRLASLASSLFDIYRQALWVQVRALVLMAMAGFLALGWTVGSALGLGFGFGLGSAVGLVLDRADVVSCGPDHEVPAVRGSERQRRLLRRATLDFGIVLVFGYLLGILVASFLAPYLISPFLIDQIFLTTNAEAVSTLTWHGEFAGLVTVVIAAILLALCQAWQAAGSSSNRYQGLGAPLSPRSST
ncbi:MAG: ABC transporter permease [Bacteroidota bacterium]